MLKIKDMLKCLHKSRSYFCALCDDIFFTKIWYKPLSIPGLKKKKILFVLHLPLARTIP